MRGAGAGPALQAAIDTAVAKGGDVYYLGVLDVDRAAWDAFLGARARLPYEVLDGVRSTAVTVRRLTCRGATVTLRRQTRAGS